MRRQVAVAVLVVGLGLTGSAHHAQAPFFDQDRTVEVRGVVKSWVFKNPHPVLTVEAKTSDGKSVEWQIQFAPATILGRRGWTAETFQPGHEIVATGHPSRAAGTYGLEHRTITWADGKPIGTPDARSPER